MKTFERGKDAPPLADETGRWLGQIAASTGSVEEITEAIAGYADVGVTRVELHPWPQTLEVLEQLAPVFTNLS